MKISKLMNVKNVSNGMVLEIKQGFGSAGYRTVSLQIPKRLGRKQMKYCKELVEEILSKVE